MLLDRGLLAQSGSRYVVTGRHRGARRPGDAAGARRGPARRPRRRRALAAPGRRRARPDLHAAGGRRARPAAGPRSERAAHGLVAKQVLAFDDDERSAERGQYSFLQALLRASPTARSRGGIARRVTSPRRATCRRTWGERGRGVRGGAGRATFSPPRRRNPTPPTRRGSAAWPARRSPRRDGAPPRSPSAARPSGSYDKAVELAEDDETRAALFEQAGRAPGSPATPTRLMERLNAAIELYEAAGRNEEVGAGKRRDRGGVRGADRLDEGLALIERALTRAFRRWAAIAPPPLGSSGALVFLRDDFPARARGDRRGTRDRRAASGLGRLPPRSSPEARRYFFPDRSRGGVAAPQPLATLAREHDLQVVAIRAQNNLGLNLISADRPADALVEFSEGTELARARGDRPGSNPDLAGRNTPASGSGAGTRRSRSASDCSSKAADDLPGHDGDMRGARDALPRARRPRGAGARGSAGRTCPSHGPRPGTRIWARRPDRRRTGTRPPRRGACRSRASCFRKADPTTRGYGYRHGLEAAWTLGDEAELERLTPPPRSMRSAARARAPALPERSRKPVRGSSGRPVRGDGPPRGRSASMAPLPPLRELGYRYETACALPRSR